MDKIEEPYLPTTHDFDADFLNTSYNNVSATTDISDFSSSAWYRYPDLQALLYEFRPVVYFIRRHLPFVWIFLGIPGNILSCIVWTKPRMKSSSGHYLAAGAFFDLINQSMRLLYAINKRTGISIYDHQGVCQLSSLVFTTCQYNHTILILAFTAERYLAIAYPFKRSQICTRTRALKVIALLVAISLAFSAIQAYFWYYDTDHGCSIRSTVTKAGVTSLWSIWSWATELLFFGIVPLMILTMNIKLIAKIKQSQNIQDESMQYFQSGSVQTAKKAKAPSATTLTLLTLSFYTIIMELPVTVLYCIMVAFPHGNPHMSDAEMRTDVAWQRYINYYAIRFTIENIAASHYALGFYISLITAPSFRREVLKLLFSKFRCMKPESYMNETHTFPKSSSLGTLEKVANKEFV